MTDNSMYLKLVSIHNIELKKYIDSNNCNIYHYTSPNGLNGIVSNHTLRFTDRNYLNDYSEGRYVMDLCLQSRFELKLPKEYRDYFKDYCQKIYDNPSKKQRYIYQCSFSTQQDELSLWNYYTKCDGIKGYNLGFLSEELSENLLTSADSKKQRLAVFQSKIVYSKKMQKEIIKQIVNDFNGIIVDNRKDKTFCHIAIEVLVEKILFVGAFFKYPHFKHENEYRLLLHLTSYWDEKDMRVKFMVLQECAKTYERNGLLIPYIDIKFPSGILKSISISPTLAFEETSCNLINALKIHSYNSDTVQITKSGIPVRY